MIPWQITIKNFIQLCYCELLLPYMTIHQLFIFNITLKVPTQLINHLKKLYTSSVSTKHMHYALCDICIQLTDF
jgi:hypothetical protein